MKVRFISVANTPFIYVRILFQACFHVELGAMRVVANNAIIIFNSTNYTLTYFGFTLDLLQALTNPTFKLIITRWKPDKIEEEVLFNQTTLVCQLVRLSRRFPFMESALRATLLFTNITLKCPIPPARYAIFNAKLGKVFPAGFFYKPNTIVTMDLSYYEHGPSDNVDFISQVLINFIIKQQCRGGNRF